MLLGLYQLMIQLNQHTRGLKIVVCEWLVVDNLQLVATSSLREGHRKRAVCRGLKAVGDVSPGYRQPLADDLLVPGNV